MSQSPVKDISPDTLYRYRLGWRTINRLLQEGKSFSGRERNCVFLNTGEARFADLSSISGFDFYDDARAIATTDWNHDGKVDFWVTNRTSPRVRLMLNQSADQNRFFCVRLEGNGQTTNRDAVGARVYLHVKNRTVPYIRSVRAGEGYLAQSSNWLSFGLGSAEAIQRLVVSWPDGSQQTFDSPNVDHWYEVRQGQDSLSLWSPPDVALHSDRVFIPKHSPANTRVILPAPLTLPVGSYRDSKGHVKTLGTNNQTLLLTLHSESCYPCKLEFEEWSRNSREFIDANVEILALSVGEESEAGSTPKNGVLSQSDLPIEAGVASSELINRVDLFQRAIIDRWRPIVTPTSILLDSDGRAVAVYRGRVSAEQVAADAKLIGLDPEALREASVPFHGRWLQSPPKGEPLRVVEQFLDRGMVDETVAYLRRWTRSVEDGGFVDREQLARSHFLLGMWLTEQRQLRAAIDAYELAASYDSKDYRVHRNLGQIYWSLAEVNNAASHFAHAVECNSADVESLSGLGLAKLRQGNFRDAIEVFETAIKHRPDSATLHAHIAEALRVNGDIPRAVVHYKRALELKPDFGLVKNNLAWILATHPDEGIRDGALALNLAKSLCTGSNNRNINALGTLSAALAESGDFSGAIRKVKLAIELAEESDSVSQLQQLKTFLTQYEVGKPIRDR